MYEIRLRTPIRIFEAEKAQSIRTSRLGEQNGVLIEKKSVVALLVALVSLVVAEVSLVAPVQAWDIVVVLLTVRGYWLLGPGASMDDCGSFDERIGGCGFVTSANAECIPTFLARLHLIIL